MIRNFVLLFSLFIISACGMAKLDPDDYKRVQSKQSTKIVIKKVPRSCPKIPKFRNDFTKPEYDKWVLTLLTNYKRCSK